MPNITIGQSRIQTPQQPQTNEIQAPEPHVIGNPDGKARVSQAKIVEVLNRDFSRREITTDSLLTRDGVRDIFGKTTLFAKVMDQTVNLVNKVSDQLSPNKTGSHLVEAKHLAMQYQIQKLEGAPQQDRINTLKALKEQISAHVGDVEKEPAKSYLAFIDVEIGLIERETDRGLIDDKARQQTEQSLEKRGELKLDSNTNEETFSNLHNEIKSFDLSKLKKTGRTEPQTEGTGTKEDPVKSSVSYWSNQQLFFSTANDEIHLGLHKPIGNHVELVRDFEFSSISDHTRDTTIPGLLDHLVGAMGELPQEEKIKALDPKTGPGQQLVEDLSNLLSKEIRDAGPKAEFAFVTSKGEDFKWGIMERLQSKLGPNDPPVIKDGKLTPEGETLSEKILVSTGAKLSNHELPNNELLIDGKTYTKDRHLGKGGFGTVDLYVAQDGTSVAVKRVLTGGEHKKEHFALAAQEARLHQAVGSDGDPNVLQMRGVARSNDGSLLIVMDSAPRGTVYDLGPKIDQAIKEGKISERARAVMKITILQDMLKGLVHMQETKGMTHFDVKGPNYLVNKDGVALLSDFGTGSTETERTFTQGKERKFPVDNPIYVAPEVLIARDEFRKRNQEIIDQDKEDIKTLITGLKAQIAGGNMKQKEGENLLTERRAQYEKKWEDIANKQFFSQTEKGDVWSMGITAYELFFGKPPFDDLQGFLSKIERKVIEFGNDDKELRQGGVGTLDRLLNAMINSDPDERPTLSQVLKMGLFDEPGVGSDTARELIKAITEDPQSEWSLKHWSDKLGA